MKWKNLRLFGTAVLLIVDIVFALSLMSVLRYNNYYGDDVISSACDTLSEIGIIVAREYLKDKRDKYVYSGTSGMKAFSDCVRVILGDSARMKYSVGSTGGTTDAGEELTIDASSRFYYKANGTCEYPPENGVPDEYESVAVGEKENERFGGLIDGLLKIKSLSAMKNNRHAELKCTVRFSELYVSDGVYLAVYAVYIGEYRTQDKIYCLYDGGILSASGMLPFSYPSEKLSADTTDIMDIMFREKTYSDGIGDGAAHEVLSISTVYRYYGKTENEYCYIPECVIEYTDGLVRTYNFITGDLTE